MGSYSSLETIFGSKIFFSHYGSSLSFFDNIFDKKVLNLRFNYSINFLLSDIEVNNIYFILNSMLRYESPLFNPRLRKSYLKNSNNFFVYLFGSINNFLSHPIIIFGNSCYSLLHFIQVNYFFYVIYYLHNIYYFRYSTYLFISRKIHLIIWFFFFKKNRF